MQTTSILRFEPSFAMLSPMKTPVANRESVSANGDQATDDRKHLRKAFDLCVRKTRGNLPLLAQDLTTWACALDGNYRQHKEDFYEIGNWTTSFFTGMGLFAWRETEDEYFLQQVLGLAPHYREKVFKQFKHTHHDVGFLYSLYSVALYKLTGDASHRQVGIRAAEVLSQRFNEKGNFIRAWGHLDTAEHANMAIIDSLMNLPLLYWASNETGDKRLHDIAVRHADTCLGHFIRKDGSVCHAFRFNLETGEPLGPENFCGFNRDSYWARGAAWAIYGFALSHGYTQDEKYLLAAVALANKFISQLDEEIVPVWDFNLPADQPRMRDASAAAIAACAIHELAGQHAADSRLLLAGKKLVDRICQDDYLDANSNCHGVLKNAYGDKAAFSSWGDYFLMEAVSRELKISEGWW